MSIAVNYSNNPRFDVVEFIQRLRKANFTQEQSEILAQETERMLEAAVNSSKEDIQALQQAIRDDVKSKDLATTGDVALARGEIRESELRLQKEIKEVAVKLIKWLLGTAIASTFAICGAIFTMFKLMLH